jgi:hypothetical protein
VHLGCEYALQFGKMVTQLLVAKAIQMHAEQDQGRKQRLDGLHRSSGRLLVPDAVISDLCPMGIFDIDCRE